LRQNNHAAIVVAVSAALATTATVSAHRLDEYLQAARIAIEDDRVEIELGLTPGVAVADAAIADLDRDHDGVLSSEEQRAYASGVTSALHLAIDDRAIEMRLAGATFPDLAAIRAGDGTIQLRLRSTVAQSAGSHRLSFTNGNHAGGSVYLANALVPDSNRVAVTAQNRDVDQREIAIDYTVHHDQSRSVPWWLFGAAGVAAVAVALRGSELGVKADREAAWRRQRGSRKQAVEVDHVQPIRQVDDLRLKTESLLVGLQEHQAR
jgi:hypothetical protein